MREGNISFSESTGFFTLWRFTLKLGIGTVRRHGAFYLGKTLVFIVISRIVFLA